MGVRPDFALWAPWISEEKLGSGPMAFVVEVGYDPLLGGTRPREKNEDVMSTRMTLQITGLRNVTSTAHLEKKIEAVPGVQSVEIDPEAERAIVEHDHADLRKIKAAIMDEGLHVTTA